MSGEDHMSEPRNEQSGMSHATRRGFLVGAAGAFGGFALVPFLATGPARATPAMMRTAMKNVVGEATVRKGKVTMDLPPLIENGNAVSVTVAVDSPMTAEDYVKAIHIFNE